MIKNEDDLDVMIKLMNIMSPDNPAYDMVLASINKKLKQEQEEITSQMIQDSRDKLRFRRAKNIDPMDAPDVTLTRGSAILRALGDHDPKSQEYLECLAELKQRAIDLNSNPAVQAFLGPEERRKGQKVSRLKEESIKAPKRKLALSEELMRAAIYLSVQDLDLKRTLIRISQEVKKMEDRHARLRKILQEEE